MGFLIKINVTHPGMKQIIFTSEFFLFDKEPINGRILDFVHKERKYCVFVFLLHVNIVSDI